MENRINQLSKWLQQKNLDFALITSSENLFYFSNYYTNPHERIVAIGLFPSNEPFLLCPLMEVAQVKSAGWSYDLLGYSDIDNPWEFIKTAIQKRNVDINNIAIEKEHLTYERVEKLFTIFPNVKINGAEEIVQKLRLIKDEKEIAILKEAAKLADYGVEVGIDAISAGKSELEIVAAIEYELKKKGVQEMSFATMVLTGAKTASPHGTPSLDTIQTGDFVLFDLGVIVDGYCSDITRTVAYQEITEKQQQIYDTVLKAQCAAIDACKPGIEIRKIDLTARNIIAEAGFGEFFTHRLGHGLGIGIHEFPSLNGANKNLLQPGMTFTIEPGIYVPNIGGVRIEDDVLVTTNGVETLTKFPKELIIVK